MATKNCHDPSIESFYNLASDLIDKGVVAITADEDTLSSNQLILSLHPEVAANEELRDMLEPVEKVRIEDETYSFHYDIDPYAPSSIGRVTVFQDAPEDTDADIPRVSLEEGIDRVSRATDNAQQPTE